MTETTILNPITHNLVTVNKQKGRFSGMGIDEIFTLTDLDFEVAKVPLFTEELNDYTTIHRPTGLFATQRTDTKRVFGAVGDRYTVVQNSEFKNLIRPLLDSGEFEVTRAGSFNGGTQVYVEGQCNGPKEVAVGDYVGCRVVFSSSHDGSRIISASLAPMRLSCLNGCTTTIKNASFSVQSRHTARVNVRIGAAREALAKIKEQFDFTLGQYREIAAKPINSAQLVKYLRDVFEIKDGEEVSTRTGNILDKILTNYSRDQEAFDAMMEQYEEPVTVNPGANLLDDMLRNFEEAPGSEIPAGRDTYWRGLQAVTYYTTHQRGTNDERRLESLWYGSSSELNRRALELALNA